MRFTLRWLFIAVLFIALSVAALLNANIYWANAAERCRYLLLSLTIVGLIYSKGAARAFWIGALVFGWIDIKPPVGQQIDDRLFDWLYSLVVREREVVSDGRAFKVWLPQSRYFGVVLDCVQTVTVGMLGGWIAMWFYSRRDARPKRADRASDTITDHT